MGYVEGERYAINDPTLLNIARLLPREVRLKLFEELIQAVGKRPLERVWQETGIRKTDLYRYLPKTTTSKRGGMTPGPANTVKIIKALLKHGRTEFVVKTLDDAAISMLRSYQRYFMWTKSLRSRNVIYNPLSDSEMNKIKRSLP